MTAHDVWTSQLSAYLDGELDPARREAVERHLAECLACRSVLEDFRAMAAAAPGYEGRDPAGDLWPGIAEAIERRRAVRFPGGRGRPAFRRFTALHLVAAALGALALGLGVAWFALRGGSPPGLGLVGTSESPATQVRLAPEEAYDRAVSDLERVLADGRDRLDTATVRVIEENLRIIDRAIAESQDAIAADPGNPDLQRWLDATRRRKLDLLRRTVAVLEI